jgi:hypothetical protein
MTPSLPPLIWECVNGRGLYLEYSTSLKTPVVLVSKELHVMTGTQAISRRRGIVLAKAELRRRKRAEEPTVLSLTAKEIKTLQEALNVFGARVPEGYIWPNEERRLWERADRILRRAESE